MPSIRQILFVAPAMFAAVAHAQGVITSAQGTKGSPASPPLQVDLTKSDANIINIDEINTNVVNECGRTLLGGNIDVGANTEDQLANKTVTSVTKGSTVSVTIDQLNANGAGPYTCDLDPTGNSIGATGQTNLTTTEKDSNNGIITLSVTMPSDLACMGASTGNVCTVRCFNTAAAGPFGGCFAVQQTDVTANKNTPQNIVTAQTLAGVTNQIAQNQKDLPAAVKSVQDAATVDQQGVLAVDELLNIDSTASATAGVASTSAATAKATSAATGKTGKSGKGTSSKGTTTATTAKGGKNANANANAKGARAFVA